MHVDTNPLVDAKTGLVSRRIFIEPEIYREELERIFARCWLFLCHDSQIPEPGDFFTVEDTNDGIILALGDICGKGLAAGSNGVARVKVPCPTCGNINQLYFEPRSGSLRYVAPSWDTCPVPEPSLN